MVGFSVLYITVILIITRWKWQADKIAAAADSTMTGIIADVCSNIPTVKSFASEHNEIESFQTHNADRFQKRQTKWFRGITLSMSQSFMNEMMLFGIIVTGVYAAFDGTMSAGHIVLLFTYSRNLFEQLWKLSRVIRDGYMAYADALEMMEIILIDNEIQDPELPVATDLADGSISFNNITFSYDEKQDDLFTDFSLHIPAGQKIGFIGESGSGKTTITKLMQRLHDVQSGSVHIGGSDIRSITKQTLRSGISHVAQEPSLFHRSLRENIMYGNPTASHEEMVLAAQRAYVHEFTTQLPDGYATKVGERGVKLSGGQRQRVAIARAFMEHTKIMILDEATSSLDSQSEKEIQGALDNIIQEDRTTIVIAHRLPTVMGLDRVVVMDNGRIIQDGDPKVLVEQKGKFKQLWNAQF